MTRSTKHRSYITRALVVTPAVLSIIVALIGADASPSANKSQLTLLNSSISAIKHNYLAPDRVNPHKMLHGSLEQIQRDIPEILVKYEGEDFITLTVGLAVRKFELKRMSTLADLKKALNDVLPFIATHYHGDTPFKEIEYAAIEGMLDELDPHSNFLSPKVYNEFKVGTRGKFGGLGIVISIKDGLLTVIAPLEGTPASRAGILAGDRIVQIDDESTINMSLIDAVSRLRGDVGTTVTIALERTGRRPRRITLTRAVINIESVKHAILKDGDKRIGYLQVKSFQSNTEVDVRNAIEEFHKDGAIIDGVILDLRNNPGGLLNIAVDLANHFLSKGTIVSTVGPYDRLIDQDVAHAEGTEPDYPVVVLINEGSASASEIVAGALKAHDRAVIIGRRSFGKGSVQTIFDLGEDSALKLTIAQYKPGGTQSIQTLGITPDIEMAPAIVDAEAMDLLADEPRSEKDLEEHLDEPITAEDRGDSQPLMRIAYLEQKKDREELERQSRREFEKTPFVGEDFTITLARNLLASANSSSRSSMLARGKPVLKKMHDEGERSIDTALKKLGIDWSSAPPEGAPALRITYRLRAGQSYVSRARAGQKISLELSATNAGSGPYSKLIAVSESKLPFLDNREFPFGRLNPGATRSWSSALDLPESMPRENMTMEVAFKEAHGREPEPIDVIIPVAELPTPLFAFSYRIPSKLKGKRLATGESIPLMVDITNVGAGRTSDETIATISNECGDELFIEKGRAKLDPMTPNITRRIAFRFHIPADFDEPHCAINIAIADIKHRVFLEKKVDVMVEDGDLSPPQGERYQPPIIKLSELPVSTEKEQILLGGTIRDTDAVRDYFVFVGDEKIAYIPNPDKTSTMPINVSLPLNPGMNQILIASRDEMGLITRKQVAIERKEKALGNKTSSGERMKNDI